MSQLIADLEHVEKDENGILIFDDKPKLPDKPPLPSVQDYLDKLETPKKWWQFWK